MRVSVLTPHSVAITGGVGQDGDVTQEAANAIEYIKM